jgi:copper chaperone
MPDTTARLSTSGMHCRSCSMLIDMTLGDVEGVTDSSTDHVAGTTVVTFDPDAVTLDEIMSAIRGAGYEAEPES